MKERPCGEEVGQWNRHSVRDIASRRPVKMRLLGDRYRARRRSQKLAAELQRGLNATDGESGETGAR